MPDTTTKERSSRSVLRVRYELKLRLLTVRAVRRLTPNMIRISFSGDFSGFKTLGFDDHIKLLFANPETGLEPIGRHYTPRAFDAAKGELTIDFALHAAGPATAWAQAAKPGDTIRLGGPRGSTLVPDAFDGYVLIGDDTALPAIGRRLEELPLGTPAFVVIEIDGPGDEVAFNTLADLSLHWVHRSARRGPKTLDDMVRGLFLPQNDVHTWVACEGEQASLIRAQLVEDHGVDPAWLKVSAYWRRGEPGGGLGEI